MKIVRRMIVYRRDTTDGEPALRDDVRFSFVDDAAVLGAEGLSSDVRLRQADRLNRFGRSYCYGALEGDRLVSFAWLLPPEIMRLDKPHLLLGAPGEAELTCAETVPGWRGKGLYGFVLMNIFAAARQQGIHQVLFKTYPANSSALRSFEKIGAAPIGSTYFVPLPGGRHVIAWPRRFR